MTVSLLKVESATLCRFYKTRNTPKLQNLINRPKLIIFRDVFVTRKTQTSNPIDIKHGLKKNGSLKNQAFVIFQRESCVLVILRYRYDAFIVCLLQVREQWNEKASEVRDRVRKEKERQLLAANVIKNNELFIWRQQQMGKAKTDSDLHVELYGGAQLAAQQENVKAKQIEQQKEKNRKLALQREKQALTRLAAQKPKPGARKETTSTVVQEPIKRSVTVATQVNDSVNSSNLSSSSSISSLSSLYTTILTDTSHDETRPTTFAEKLQSEHRPKSAIKKGQKSLSRDNSDVELAALLSRTTYDTLIDNDLKRRKSAPNRKDVLDVIDLTECNSEELVISRPVPTITKVSDLLKVTRASKNTGEADQTPRLKSSLHKPSNKDELPPKSPPKPIIIRPKAPEQNKSPNPKPILKRHRVASTSPKLQPKPILKKDVNKTQKTPKKPAVKQMAETEKPRSHYVPRFTASTKPNDRQAATSGVPKTVQFYDHPNRYAREYEVPTNIVQKDDEAGANAQQNAMEETQKNTQLEQRRVVELAEAR